ncbi:MAG: TonB family protein [Betaproteobacteria bacterium]|nr:TonB family protein [Betaproteobacteria bacterium]
MSEPPHGGRQADSSREFWRALPLAALLWALMIIVFGRLLAVPERPATASAIDARLVELPQPAAGPPHGAPAAPAQTPRAMRAHRQASTTRRAPAFPAPRPLPQPAPAARHPAPIAKPAPERRPGTDDLGRGIAAAPGAPQAIGEAQGAPSAAMGSPATSRPAPANAGPQATYQPRPRLPEWARRETMDARAVALFHVAADGRARVELARATDDPRLNEVILRALRQWRFLPALEAGKPIASVLKVPVRLRVR